MNISYWGLGKISRIKGLSRLHLIHHHSHSNVFVMSAELYNSLPSIDEANSKFVNRDHIFSELAPLFAAYGNKFGVCLVHRHCTLEEGELMVATDNVSQPERDVQCYPERWLATGEPYEFTRTPTQSPPQGLLEEFRKIVHGMLDVLGLFYMEDRDHSGGVFVERTEGRKNIVEVVPHGHSSNDISTGWLPGLEKNGIVYTCSPAGHGIVYTCSPPGHGIVYTCSPSGHPQVVLTCSPPNHP